MIYYWAIDHRKVFITDGAPPLLSHILEKKFLTTCTLNKLQLEIYLLMLILMVKFGAYCSNEVWLRVCMLWNISKTKSYRPSPIDSKKQIKGLCTKCINRKKCSPTTRSCCHLPAKLDESHSTPNFWNISFQFLLIFFYLPFFIRTFDILSCWNKSLLYINNLFVLHSIICIKIRFI